MRIVSRWSLRGVLFMVVLAAIMTVDSLLGLAYRTSTTANVTIIPPRSEDAHRAIVVFPGYMMSGVILGKAFAQHISTNDVLVVVDYPERGLNVDQINEKVLTALQKIKPEELCIYGASMGGMLAKLFLDRYRQLGAPYGKVLLVLDSVPASQNEIKRPAFLFGLSCWYRGGPLSSAVWAAVSECMKGPPIEENADPALVRAGRHFGAWAGIPAATSQACFISKFGPLSRNELVDIANQVVFLHGYSPQDDPLVRIYESTAGWRKAFPKILDVTIQGRAAQWHLPLIERPRETVKAMTAQYNVLNYGEGNGR